MTENEQFFLDVAKEYRLALYGMVRQAKDAKVEIINLENKLSAERKNNEVKASGVVKMIEDLFLLQKKDAVGENYTHIEAKNSMSREYYALWCFWKNNKENV